MTFTFTCKLSVECCSLSVIERTVSDISNARMGGMGEWGNNKQQEGNKLLKIQTFYCFIVQPKPIMGNDTVALFNDTELQHSTASTSAAEENRNHFLLCKTNSPFSSPNRPPPLPCSNLTIFVRSILRFETNLRFFLDIQPALRSVIQ